MPPSSPQRTVRRSFSVFALATFVFVAVGQPQPAFPDGNVSVALLADGTLTITGGNSANGIDVYVPATQPGTILVEGTLFGEGPTTINGSTHFTVALRLVESIVVSTGGERDHVTLSADDPENPLIVPGDLEIQTGQFRDFVWMSNVVVGGQVSINTGQQDDHVRIADCYINGDLVVDTGNNGQPVFREDVFISQVAVGGDTGILTGHGDDYVVIHASDFHGILAIGLGEGDDVLNFQLFGPAEDPTTTAGTALLSGGQGDDHLDLPSLLAAGELAIIGFETVNP